MGRSASFPGRLPPAKRFHRNGWVFPTRRPLFFASTKPEALHQPRPFPASSNRSASVWEFNRREALQSEKRQKGGALPLRRPGGSKRFRLNHPGAEWLSNRHRASQGRALRFPKTFPGEALWFVLALGNEALRRPGALLSNPSERSASASPTTFRKKHFPGPGPSEALPPFPLRLERSALLFQPLQSGPRQLKGSSSF